MVAGGTAQIPPCPAPPVTGGHIQLLEGGVSQEGLQSSVCLSVCERALSISSWWQEDVILCTKHSGGN